MSAFVSQPHSMQVRSFDFAGRYPRPW